MTRTSNLGRNVSSLIPVLVTGIQQRRVCGAAESFRPKDLGRLDSCDKHRNEGGRNRGCVDGTDLFQRRMP
ncbi:hypothetical protein GFL39_03885 [Rhizobium leguminosarum bv. viciae]|nr:hypothetical protein [Rhizobium leguminosarum bv. viciae]NKL04111.1 hypothetical protein [Rhizobium leguminosarum bv. viciae]NKL86370.1 hypothetical protein [Rhizobium leguminosarum bv. viciae]NKL89275.1 hypothetical protein [Rhizobium leguminosarum bv. viciae]